jgi:hypothetical protein
VLRGTACGGLLLLVTSIFMLMNSKVNASKSSGRTTEICGLTTVARSNASAGCSESTICTACCALGRSRPFDTKARCAISFGAAGAATAPATGIDTFNTAGAQRTAVTVEPRAWSSNGSVPGKLPTSIAHVPACSHVAWSLKRATRVC